MTRPLKSAEKTDAVRPVESYYQWQSKIYDLTRWSFLFGRTAMVRHLGELRPQATRILEVGCGTGHNLWHLAKVFPQARLIGIDVSTDMMQIAERKLRGLEDRVHLRRQMYESPLVQNGEQPVDVVLFSYALSMFNPGWEKALSVAWADLRVGGLLAMVDFHRSPFYWFQRWMSLNHVRMDGHLLAEIKERFPLKEEKVTKAYGGLWEWVQVVAEKADHAEGDFFQFFPMEGAVPPREQSLDEYLGTSQNLDFGRGTALRPPGRPSSVHRITSDTLPCGSPPRSGELLAPVSKPIFRDAQPFFAMDSLRFVSFGSPHGCTLAG